MKGLNVLVVDDDRFNLAVIESYLNKLFPEFNLTLCQDSRKVEGLVEDGSVDILLLDLIMPHVTGFEIIENIREKIPAKDLQIIVLTSLSDKDNFQRCFNLGANDYLKKPIDSTEFKARIGSVAKARTNDLLMAEMVAKLKEQNEELVEANEKLKKTKFQLIQNDKLSAIGQLAAGVAHEINNPVGYVANNIRTMAKYMEKMKTLLMAYEDETKELDLQKVKSFYDSLNIDFILEDIEDIIDDSEAGVDKISQIVKALSSFSRSSESNEKMVTSLTTILSQVLLIIKNEYKYNIDLTTDYLEKADVLVNETEVSQVFLNLLINAVYAIKQAHPESGGQLKVTTYDCDDFVCAEIKDNGIGIPDDKIAKIFNPFFTTKPVGKGTGLGLSISYDIITNKHGGVLDVESKKGQGTTFTVKFPKEK